MIDYITKAFTPFGVNAFVAVLSLSMPILSCFFVLRYKYIAPDTLNPCLALVSLDRTL